MTSAAEERAFLDQLHALGVADLEKMWSAAKATADPFAYMLAAYPELAAQYAGIAAEAAAVWYDDSPGGVPGFVAAPAEIAPAAQFAGSAAWALSSAGDAGFDKLAGAFQGDIWDAARETKIVNAEDEPGSTYVREAGPKACEFCRMLATRGAVYTSRKAAKYVVGRGKRGETRGKQAIGKRFHDNCSCRIVEVRAGESYQPLDYMADWEQEYRDAVRATPSAGPYGAVELKPLMRTMRERKKAADAADAAKSPAPDLDAITDTDELAALAQKAIDDEDFDLLDKIDARERILIEETAKRDAVNAAARDRRAAAAQAKREQQDADYDRHVAEGKSGEEAIELAYGVSIEQQRRESVISSLRSSGYSGAGFDELTRNAYADVVHDEWLAAENAVTFLVRKELAAKVDGRELWKVNESTARKWATPEMLEWWDQNGRTTLDGYRAGLLGGMQQLARGGDFLQ